MGRRRTEAGPPYPRSMGDIRSATWRLERRTERDLIGQSLDLAAAGGEIIIGHAAHDLEAVAADVIVQAAVEIVVLIATAVVHVHGGIFMLGTDITHGDLDAL